MHSVELKELSQTSGLKFYRGITDLSLVLKMVATFVMQRKAD